jgi:hypothetical protein
MTEIRGQMSEVHKGTARKSGLLFAPSSLLLALTALLFALCLPVWAQQPSKIPRIGYLAVSALDESRIAREAFQRGLLDLGYVEGKKYQR